MTEKFVKTGRLKSRHIIDPIAFLFALIAAPFAATVLTFWAIVPMFALYFGAPIYLITATPVLLWWLGRSEPDALPIIGLALAANTLAAGVIYVLSNFSVLDWPQDSAMMYLGFGSFFAPLWAGIFAVLYRNTRRDFFTQTLS